MRILVFSIFFLALNFASAAQKTSYPAHRLPAQGISEIRVSGVRGKLVLKSKPTKMYSIKVKHTKGRFSEDWNLSVQRRGTALIVEVASTEYGHEWRKQVRQDLWPEFDVELEGPSQPTVISWREGEIEIEGWSAAVDASFLSGPFMASAMTGALKVQAVDSRVRVRDHRGDLDLKGERGRVDLVNARGSLNLSWVSGTIRAENCGGQVRIDSTEGHMDARNSTGSWVVKLRRGEANFTRISGKLKAEGDASKWKVSAVPPAQIDVRSASGAVDVKWLAGGVKMFLTSLNGEIRVPKPYQVEDREGLKVVEAHRKSKPEGEVFVRTSSGTIIWR